MFTLQEALKAIESKPEFRVNERSFGFNIDYMVTMPGTFVGNTEKETGILQNLRGTCFNQEGKIISLAYHKFHNLNENEEYKASNFDWNIGHEIQEKLDGSMIRPIPFNNGTYRLGTRAGITDVSILAEEFVQTMEPFTRHAYNDFNFWCIGNNYTPIYEFCSRKNRVVIDYPESQLVLTGIRCNESGLYVKVRVPERIKTVNTVLTDAGSISDLAEFIKNRSGEEGVVVKFANGDYVKIKCDEYVLQHRALDGLKFEKDVLKLILTDKLDDILPILTKEKQDSLNAYKESVFQRLALATQEMELIFERNRHVPTKKMFAELVVKSPYKTGLFKMWDGQTYSLKDYVLNHCGSITDVESVRWLIGKSYLEF